MDENFLRMKELRLSREKHIKINQLKDIFNLKMFLFLMIIKILFLKILIVK